jgi:hypothetical protein
MGPTRIETVNQRRQLSTYERTNGRGAAMDSKGDVAA